MTILIFEPSFPTVYSGESVDFMLNIQNQGTVDATDVKSRVIGLDTWDNEGGTCEEWERISPAVPDIGAPGETKNCRWTYAAPDVPQGLSTKYSPTIRLYYGYRTSFVKSVFFASSKELRTMMDRGQALPTQTTSQTTGPIQIDIKTEAPVRFWESSVEFPLAITVSNVGGGVVCPSQSDCESGQNTNMLSLDIESGNDISITDCETDIELWQGKTNTLVCQATFSGLSDVDTAQRTISIDADYGYYTDKTTQVTVASR